MQHIAIMKKEWELTQQILDGVKTVESRWYKFKIAPWDRITAGDILYFKDTGSTVKARAIVSKVIQYEVLNNTHAITLMRKYALEDLGTTNISENISNYIKDKKYAIFIHFNNVEEIPPFEIDKAGFGMQCAWMCVENVATIKLQNPFKATFPC